MKIHFKIFTLGMCSVLCVAMVGCGQTERRTVYELPYYDGSAYEDGAEKANYNNELWRRNDTDWSGSDPFILDNTARDGKYYRYTSFRAQSSSDLSHWYDCGMVMELPAGGWGDAWAAEVVYDDPTDDGEDNGKYYIYFSATFPDAKSSGAYKKDVLGPNLTTVTQPRSLYVGVADSPLGPFRMVDFTSAAQVGQENVRVIDPKNYSYDSTYVKYALFEPIAMNAACAKTLYDRVEEGEDYMSNNIDPSPFVDPVTKKKYLLFNDERQPSPILIMEMENWLKPKYETLKVIARSGYYTVEDFDRAQKGETVEKIPFENLTNKVSEGPFMHYRNGKYYLTFSINGYTDPTYAVAQAVSDRVDGGFRKLTEEENGFMLSADDGGNKFVTGTGHHCFFNIGEKLFICYHVHTTPNTIEDGRAYAIDEVKFVPITDTKGQTTEVMYVNGPTVTLQPAVREGMEYGDISERASVKMLKGKLAKNSSENWLNDGLLTFNERLNQAFHNKYVKETEITEDSTFEISFENYETVCGFMVYNSKHKNDIFYKIKNIEFISEENGAEKTYFIKELNLDPKANLLYNDFELQYGNYVLDAVAYGGGVNAEFEPKRIKTIRFTVEVPSGQEKVGISEVAVIGKIN